MLYYDRPDVSKGNDVDEISEPKECDICYYWYFLNKRFKFQPYVCNKCHDLLMISMKLSDTAVLKNEIVNCCCIITGISKSEAINLKY